MRQSTTEERNMKMLRATATTIANADGITVHLSICSASEDATSNRNVLIGKQKQNIHHHMQSLPVITLKSHGNGTIKVSNCEQRLRLRR
jgi:hypothetical protein